MARDQPSGVTDVLLGLLWALTGVLLAGAGVLRLVPSVYALGAMALVAGAVGVLGALVGRSHAGFWAELVPGALLMSFGVLVVRFAQLDAHALGLLAGAILLADGLVRLGSAREFPPLRGTLLVAGLLSLLMGGLVLWDGIPVTTAGIAVLIGCELVVAGVTATLVGRPVRPARRRS